jgi:hypothetical protein
MIQLQNLGVTDWSSGSNTCTASQPQSPLLARVQQQDYGSAHRQEEPGAQDCALSIQIKCVSLQQSPGDKLRHLIHSSYEFQAQNGTCAHKVQ